jgi:hypothetical protein
VVSRQCSVASDQGPQVGCLGHWARWALIAGQVVPPNVFSSFLSFDDTSCSLRVSLSSNYSYDPMDRQELAYYSRL